jgi:hypothetical protein
MAGCSCAEKAFDAAYVAAVEQREAAFGCKAVVKSGDAVFQEDRVFRIDGCFARARTEPNAASRCSTAATGLLI